MTGQRKRPRCRRREGYPPALDAAAAEMIDDLRAALPAMFESLARRDRIPGDHAAAATEADAAPPPDRGSAGRRDG